MGMCLLGFIGTKYVPGMKSFQNIQNKSTLYLNKIIVMYQSQRNHFFTESFIQDVGYITSVL